MALVWLHVLVLASALRARRTQSAKPRTGSSAPADKKPSKASATGR